VLLHQLISLVLPPRKLRCCRIRDLRLGSLLNHAIIDSLSEPLLNPQERDASKSRARRQCVDDVSERDACRSVCPRGGRPSRQLDAPYSIHPPG
jgi:hypothetical protein